MNKFPKINFIGNKEKIANGLAPVNLVHQQDVVSFIAQILNENIFIVYLQCKDFDKYGRLLADVYTDHKKSI